MHESLLLAKGRYNEVAQLIRAAADAYEQADNAESGGSSLSDRVWDAVVADDG